jgi:hypothetical protein
MNAYVKHALLVAVVLIGLPPAGIVLSGGRLSAYLEFPPLTRHVPHAGFSWSVFILFAAIDVLALAGMGMLLKKAYHRTRPAAPANRYPFPFWGWIGLSGMLLGWLMAWTRFEWFAPLQHHTFCLPWVGYILLSNALCVKQSGRSLMTDTPGRFLLLFPASALFWWFFEYLNRFVQNWYYVGVDHFSPGAYTLFASLAFATVLPAVMSTYRLLLTTRLFGSGLTGHLRLTFVEHPRTARIIVCLSAPGLGFLGVLPDILFALVWVSPLLILTALQILTGRPTIFSALSQGNWRPIITAATAALVCGFFWEMWNIGSLARWEYAIPYVDRFHIFAMPLLGYGGYLPFGLECLAISRLLTADADPVPNNDAR